MKEFILLCMNGRETTRQEPFIIVSALQKGAQPTSLAPISFYDILQYTPDPARQNRTSNKMHYREYTLVKDISFTVSTPCSMETITVHFTLEQDKLIIQKEDGQTAKKDYILLDILQNFGIIKGNNLSFLTVLRKKTKAAVNPPPLYRTTAAGD
ncbi:hypothetical protein [Bacillus sp. V5-8f]|uniref:hypothetical protein n=1 Tax=Bacillus sp. V5-8f TaxID=2053044 RepID=UPI000C78568E|nr:hypothetical protein [Bacillus sp. V5-8f]PLT35830.1 hypothetical protein CUU64_00715 [Bacillus sp. V5-8f]